MTVRRIVVIGGGISGLCAAWAARRAAAHLDGGLEVVVLERESQVGGKARTLASDGWLVEAGPSGFLGGRAEFDRIIRDVGLDDERVEANGASAHRFIMVGGRMRGVGRGPVALVRSGLLSVRGALRLMGELLVPRRTDGAEESVWDFAHRRMGRQVADGLVRPMALGIYAGDARRLSVEATFPRMSALEREHGSLIRGLLARRGNGTSGALTSFRRGMQSLPKAIAERGGCVVRTGEYVHALTHGGDRWLVHASRSSAPIPADAVILAAEPFAAAPLLRPYDAGAADALAAIACPPVSIVGLGYRRADAARLPNGFGVLIARGEGLRALGNLWESHLYPARSPDGTVLVRALYGGQVDPEAGALTDAELIALARSEAERMYGITAAPVHARAHRWARAIPQYDLGHLARVARIERGVESLRGLFITGFGLRAIGFSDAAVQAVRVGERVAAWLNSGAATPVPV